eukprot:6116889-Prymnesium_polylepis.1
MTQFRLPVQRFPPSNSGLAILFAEARLSLLTASLFASLETILDPQTTHTTSRMTAPGTVQGGKAIGKRAGSLSSIELQSARGHRVQVADGVYCDRTRHEHVQLHALHVYMHMHMHMDMYMCMQSTMSGVPAWAMAMAADRSQSGVLESSPGRRASSSPFCAVDRARASPD